MNKTTLILLIVFTVLVIIGLATYIVIFSIQKSYFKKLKKQIRKYSDLKTKLQNINVYRLDVLAQNKMLNQSKFEQLKNNYTTLKDNCHTIYLDLTNAYGVVRSMNLKNAKNVLNRIASDMEKTEDEIQIFIEEFNKSTQYSDGIEDSLQVAIDLFNDIKHFYYSNIIHCNGFKTINKLIDLIQDIIDRSIDFSSTYDFDNTVKIFSDLHSKIKTLWKAIMAVLKLQFVDVYLKTAYEKNKALLSKANFKLVYKDREYIQKANTIYENDYGIFNKAYLEFDLPTAYKYAIITAKDMANISKFCYINTSSQELIYESVKVINEQTDTIISNKEKILESLNGLATYFAKDQKMLNYFNQINADVKQIESLHNTANQIDSLSTEEKIKALRQLAQISITIAKCKDSINDNVGKINYTLGNIISLLTQLNELYTYYIQMLPTIKILGNDNPVREEFISLVNGNINEIEKCVQEIISNDNPNFKEISDKISAMIDETQIVKEKINSTVILKSYASKLMFYANRYKKESTLTLFEKAEEEYRGKKYSQCIETLLVICKKAK